MWRYNQRHRGWYLGGHGCTAIARDTGVWTVSNELGVFLRSGENADVEQAKAEAAAAHADLTELTTVAPESGG